MKLLNHKKQLSSFSGLLILIVAAIIVSITIGGCSETTEQQTKESPKMKMTTEIPEAITTPDKVETRIGTLEFFDGIPTKETSQLVYDHLDFSRAMETFLNGIPAASIEALRRGAADCGPGPRTGGRGGAAAPGGRPGCCCCCMLATAASRWLASVC